MRQTGARRALAPAAFLLIAACAPIRPLPRSAPAMPTGAPALAVTLLRVDKGARRLDVWSGERLVRTFAHVQLGFAPIGSKRFEGDGKTPEGRYTIDWRNPRSAYHLSLHVSYPNAEDAAFARNRGHSAGGLIMIHGQPNGAERRMAGDWTDGCIALSNAEIEELWDIVPDGTAIEIRP